MRTWALQRTVCSKTQCTSQTAAKTWNQPTTRKPSSLTFSPLTWISLKNRTNNRLSAASQSWICSNIWTQHRTSLYKSHTQARRSAALPTPHLRQNKWVCSQSVKSSLASNSVSCRKMARDASTILTKTRRQPLSCSLHSSEISVVTSRT